MTDMHENYIQIERQEVRKFAYVSELPAVKRNSRAYKIMRRFIDNGDYV